jgi:YegS/Rv2252/BmrU family lipid kinase
MPKKINVIINPAAGRPEPILNTLNSVFHNAGIRWTVSITQESGDAERFAQEGLNSGYDVVAAYGGDGTVMEVARGLLGTQVPMAILPGGTANLMSVELGIPKDLTKAAEVAANPDSLKKWIDMGQFGDTYFMLRVGLGFSARKVEYADRQLKDRFGILAYSIAGIKALTDSNKAHYSFTLDGKQVEADGLACLVDNAGNIGIPGISPLKEINVSDGLLDVILARSEAFKILLQSTPGRKDTSSKEELYFHWQAREIRIETDPPQPVQVDGELVGETTVDIKVVPKAVSILTPVQ